MRVDVSEIKTFKTCRRQWQLSSRNKMHLRPMVTPAAFATGTLFHESLHSLYMGTPIDKVMATVRKEMTGDNDMCLLAMIPGYEKEVLWNDLERFKVKDIEHKFSIDISGYVGLPEGELTVCGSIDMICIERDTNKVFGFEHKTAKNFRDSSYLWMDEQPRVYTVALIQYVDELNKKEPGKNYTLGGIYINEVKKLLRKFDYRRTLCTYPDDDLANFWGTFAETCCGCKIHADRGVDAFERPSPSYFHCSMCDFRDVCETYMYGNVTKAQILDEFKEELVEREMDHLDEKVERNDSK